MKHLRKLLYKVPIDSVLGNTDVYINKITFDSRTVDDKSLFLAVKGELFDGFNYIDSAISNGAIVIICNLLPQKWKKNVVYVIVKDVNIALGIISDNFYNSPSLKIKLIGITGTNGKTTASTLLFELFKKENFSVGLISTICIKYLSKSFDSRLTTPDPIQINYHLNKMKKLGVLFCFMEVSSHGIAQSRITGLNFYGGVFTNLTHDHLDYHKTFKNYRDVKKMFFDSLSENAFALTNTDDKNGLYMVQNTKAKKYTFSIKNNANFNFKVLENELTGMLLKYKNHEFCTRLVGKFNASNLLLVFGVSKIIGIKTLNILKQISQIGNVEGRFQVIKTYNNKTIIIDYAHTPDALKNVLKTITEIRTRNEKLITLFGCGGDRDRDKRALMGKIAAIFSDKVILTSDNPRNENPLIIIQEIINGVASEDFKKIIKISDREEAINTSIEISKPGDIVLIAGKGHEMYQEINGQKNPFNDLKILTKILENQN